ncbi:MAG: hypothetical protein KF893_17625 [Caldilineaceae bacterium]|nr:hypothetical protein [Caldilineaceae bacterium]
MNQNALTVLRAEFIQAAGRSLSLPIAGALVWTIVGIAALILPQSTATYVLLFGSGAIFPIGLAVARVLGENLIANTNPLSRLMGLCVLMVNLLWALHLTLLFTEARVFPLSLGIGLGLHWVVFSWIIGHPVGTIHAVLRTFLATGLWWLLPAHPISAVALGVVVAYGYAIFILIRRPVGISGVHGKS